MKHLITFFTVIALMAIFSIHNSFGQSESDVCKGNFSPPSYKAKNDAGDYSLYSVQRYVYSDGTEGKLYYKKKCGKYYIDIFTGENYYSDFTTAMKALYAYKKYNCKMDGNVQCN